MKDALARCMAGVAGIVLATSACAQTFEHEDWQLACDNTRTCRAAGYQRDDSDDTPVSVLLTRAAGPGTAVDGEVALSDMADDATHPSTVRMSVAGRAVGTVAIDGQSSHGKLSPAQVAALLKALVGTGAIVFSGEGATWTLSGKGAASVLLKMDDVQGRIGTPSALARRGSESEARVLQPLAMPVVQAVRVPKGKASDRADAALAARILAAIPKSNDCDMLAADAQTRADAPDSLSLWHLDAKRVLVSTLCWRGAYNEGDGYWIANARPPYDPKLVTNAGTDFDEATGISSQQKGRGIADCVANDNWTWNGRDFVHTDESTSGMCRAVEAGGAWNLPTLVAKVIPAK